VPRRMQSKSRTSALDASMPILKNGICGPFELGVSQKYRGAGPLLMSRARDRAVEPGAVVGVVQHGMRPLVFQDSIPRGSSS
jgi:hypothetical protein